MSVPDCALWGKPSFFCLFGGYWYWVCTQRLQRLKKDTYICTGGRVTICNKNVERGRTKPFHPSIFISIYLSNSGIFIITTKLNPNFMPQKICNLLGHFWNRFYFAIKITKNFGLFWFDEPLNFAYLINRLKKGQVQI